MTKIIRLTFVEIHLFVNVKIKGIKKIINRQNGIKKKRERCVA